MAKDVVHEVYAVRYARRDARRPEHFLGGDPHDAPMPMDYFVWAVTGPAGSWVIGGATCCARRRRRWKWSASTPPGRRTWW